jgi:hypothetical protein
MLALLISGARAGDSASGDPANFTGRISDKSHVCMMKDSMQPKAGLARVAIGHGETEGPYDAGGGYRGSRAEEPIRVTVVYFVTPVGDVTPEDMESFAVAFARWDTQAIWGGSFVTKETF